jgi:hypothetical protein
LLESFFTFFARGSSNADFQSQRLIALHIQFALKKLNHKTKLGTALMPQPSVEVSTQSLSTSETTEAIAIKLIQNAQELLLHTPTADKLGEHLDELEIMIGSISTIAKPENDPQLQRQCEMILKELAEKIKNLEHPQDALVTSTPEPLSLPKVMSM